MAYKMLKNITAVNKIVTGGRTIKYIVVHYTGNETDRAESNANYFKNVNRGSSAHYFVDSTTVVQVVEDKDVAWAVGKNYGSNNLFGTVTNNNSISIEMCSTGSKIADATFNNTVELTKQLMKKYNIPASNVYRHFDVCSKQCPGWAGWGTRAGDNGSLWTKFKNAITQTVAQPNPYNTKAYTIAGQSNSLYAFKTTKSVVVRVAPNDKADKVTTIPAGSSQGINQITSDGWGHLGNNAGWILLKGNATPVNNTSYVLKNTHSYVRKLATTHSDVVTDLKKGSKQGVCFITNDNWGLISNFAGWIPMKLWTKVSVIATPTIRKGDRGTNVKTLQNNLNAAINAKLTVDGVCGDKTVSAIKKFQTKNGVKSDGVYGPNTRSKMNKVLN